MLAERLPHFLQLFLQLCLVTVAKLLSAHLLGLGEVMEGLSEVKVMLLLQRVGSHVRQVPSAHLRAERRFVVRIIRQPRSQCPTRVDGVKVHCLGETHPLHVLGILIFGCCHSCQIIGLRCSLLKQKGPHVNCVGSKKHTNKLNVYVNNVYTLIQHIP